MSALAILLVLTAAFFHAGWNALAKGASDRTITFGLIALGHVLPAIPFVFLLPAPDPEAIPFIIASTVIHWGYYYFLHAAYGFGDLSVAYPIARGASPLIIAVGAIFLAEETLPVSAWFGICLISGGIMLLAAGRAMANRRKTIATALATAVAVAAYSLADGIGVRVSGAPFSYIAWLFVAEAFVAVFILAPRISAIRRLGQSQLSRGLLGGVISGAAYALVLFAQTLEPLGPVSALRETSVIIATLIGLIWFGERPVFVRLLASVIVTAGSIAITLS